MSKIMYKDKQILGCISDAKYAAYDNTGTGLSATNAQDAITELNGKLESLPGRLIKLGSAASNGEGSGTFTTNVTINNSAVYFVIIRQSGDNNSLAVTPIINGYFNPTYINVINNKISLIFSGSWGFGYVYKLM